MSHCRGALTLVHVAASSVTADSKTHLHMDQLDSCMNGLQSYGYGNDDVLSTWCRYSA